MKAKFRLKTKQQSDLGAIVYSTVELLDADGVMKEYGVKDYYGESGIEATEISCMETGDKIDDSSKLGEKIMEYFEEDEYMNSEFYRYNKSFQSGELFTTPPDTTFGSIPCSADLDNEMYNESI